MDPIWKTEPASRRAQTCMAECTLGIAKLRKQTPIEAEKTMMEEMEEMEEMMMERMMEKKMEKKMEMLEKTMMGEKMEKKMVMIRTEMLRTEMIRVEMIRVEKKKNREHHHQPVDVQTRAPHDTRSPDSAV